MTKAVVHLPEDLKADLERLARDEGRMVSAMRTIPGPYLLSPFILAELDNLIATRVGNQADS